MLDALPPPPGFRGRRLRWVLGRLLAPAVWLTALLGLAAATCGPDRPLLSPYSGGKLARWFVSPGGFTAVAVTVPDLGFGPTSQPRVVTIATYGRVRSGPVGYPAGVGGHYSEWKPLPGVLLFDLAVAADSDTPAAPGDRWRWVRQVGVGLFWLAGAAAAGGGLWLAVGLWTGGPPDADGPAADGPAADGPDADRSGRQVRTRTVAGVLWRCAVGTAAGWGGLCLVLANDSGIPPWAVMRNPHFQLFAAGALAMIFAAAVTAAPRSGSGPA